MLRLHPWREIAIIRPAVFLAAGPSRCYYGEPRQVIAMLSYRW